MFATRPRQTPKISFAVDQEKAAGAGISTEAVAQSLRIALSGMGAGHFIYLIKKWQYFKIPPIIMRSSIGDTSPLWPIIICIV